MITALNRKVGGFLCLDFLNPRVTRMIDLAPTTEVLTTVADDERVFFLYRHWRFDPIIQQEVCFYVGRGKHNPKYKAYKSRRYRAFSNSGRNNDWNELANASEWRVEVVADFLTFDEVCALEDYYVEVHGRIDLGTGTTTNLCKGGTGTKDRVSKRKTLQGHIDDNVAYIPFTGCWIWLGTKIDGRCKINIDNKTVDARRHIYEQTNDIKLHSHKQGVICTCGYDDCVNPHHVAVIKGTNNQKGVRKKITDEDIEDAKRLFPYFYPSQIADLFPNITPLTLKALSTSLQVEKVEIKEFDWTREIENHSTKHLSLEDVVDMKRLHKAGVSAHKIAGMYNLNRTKVIAIAKGYKGKMFFKNL